MNVGGRIAVKASSKWWKSRRRVLEQRERDRAHDKSCSYPAKEYLASNSRSFVGWFV